MIFCHFPIDICIVIQKKVPTWEGKVVEQKQKQFWNQWNNGNNLGACKIGIFKLFSIRITLVMGTSISCQKLPSVAFYWPSPRVILIFKNFWISHWACSQVVTIASLVSELFLLLLYDISFPYGSVSAGLCLIFEKSGKLLWPNHYTVTSSVALCSIIMTCATPQKINLTTPFQENHFLLHPQLDLFLKLCCYFNALVRPNLQGWTSFDLLIIPGVKFWGFSFFLLPQSDF